MIKSINIRVRVRLVTRDHDVKQVSRYNRHKRGLKTVRSKEEDYWGGLGCGFVELL